MLPWSPSFVEDFCGSWKSSFGFNDTLTIVLLTVFVWLHVKGQRGSQWVFCCIVALDAGSRLLYEPCICLAVPDVQLVRLLRPDRPHLMCV